MKQELCSEIGFKEIETWLSNKNDAKAIIDKALLARAAREKAKERLRKLFVSRKTKRANLPGTLADAVLTIVLSVKSLS